MIRLWRLPTKKDNNVNTDMIPELVFRGHSGAGGVLSVCYLSPMNRSHLAPYFKNNSDILLTDESLQYCGVFFSGGFDSTVRVWRYHTLPTLAPEETRNDGSVTTRYDTPHQTLVGHSDIVWHVSSLSCPAHSCDYLASASADGSVKIWMCRDGESQWTLKFTYRVCDTVPSCVTLVESKSNGNSNGNGKKSPTVECYVGYTNGTIKIFNFEAEKSISTFRDDAAFSATSSQFLVNDIVVIPTMSWVISAHEDHHVRVWDIAKGSLVHSMNCHLDAVTSLSLLSCSYSPKTTSSPPVAIVTASDDCSLRFWTVSVDAKNSKKVEMKCTQEHTCHRKKFDAGILGVTVSGDGGLVASCGADGIVKVFGVE